MLYIIMQILQHFFLYLRFALKYSFILCLCILTILDYLSQVKPLNTFSSHVWGRQKRNEICKDVKIDTILVMIIAQLGLVVQHKPQHLMHSHTLHLWWLVLLCHSDKNLLIAFTGDFGWPQYDKARFCLYTCHCWLSLMVPPDSHTRLCAARVMSSDALHGGTILQHIMLFSAFPLICRYWLLCNGVDWHLTPDGWASGLRYVI